MSKRKLLLADDSITIQKVVNLTFADEGIEVISVGDGNSAMDKLREDSPDLVMADVNMPGLNGYEVCEKIKQSDTNNSIPVILLVGSFEPFDEEEAKRVGADDYLTKPFQSISQLVEKVSELLKPKETIEDFKDTAEMPFDSEELLSYEDDSDVLAKDDPDELALLSGNFDDEMIQTNQIGSVPIDDSVKYETASEDLPEIIGDEMLNEQSAFELFDQENTVDEDISTESEFSDELDDSVEVDDSDEIEDFHKTQPLTSQDFQELAINESTDDFDESYLDDDVDLEFDSDSSDYDSEDNDEEEIETSEENSFEPFNTSEVEETQESTEVNFEEADETINKAESEVQLENDSEDHHIQEEIYFDEEEERSRLPMPEVASILELDEVNLLDLPPLDDVDEPEFQPQTSIDENAQENMESVNGEVEDVADHENNTEEFEIRSEQDTSDEVDKILNREAFIHGNSYEGLSETDRAIDRAVSPEMVEVITKKVVERLSERAVREIAWEVVPQLADLIIKKLVEEKMKE